MNAMFFLLAISPFLAFLPMLYFVYYYFRKGEFNLESNWNFGLLSLFLWSMFVGVYNFDWISSLASLVIFGYLLVSLYVQEKYSHPYEAEKLFLSLFLISVVSAVIGLLEKINIITYQPAWWKYLFGMRSIVEISEPYRISGTFNNPNLAGTWYAVMVVIGVYFFRRAIGYKKVLFLLGILLFFTVLVMTGSRGATIGLFLGFVMYAYFAGHKKKMLTLMFLLLSGIVLMLFFPEYFPRGDILFSSIRDRQAIWENSLYMFMMKPLTGWGIFGIYYADSQVYHYLKVFHAHNTILTFATTLGTVGLSIFLWMQWSVFQNVRSLYRHHCRLTPLLGAIQGIVFGQGLFDFTIMSPQIGILFVTSSAIVESLLYSYGVERIHPSLSLVFHHHKKWRKA